MAWFHLPVVGGSTPDEVWDAKWLVAGPTLRRMVRAGFNVVVHCIGRFEYAGTVAARLLVELGVAADVAVEAVRKAVPSNAIGARDQEAYARRHHAVPPGRPEKSAEAIRDRATGAMLGLAVGDAVGTTLEFKRRDSYSRLSDMVGGGPFRLKPGEWTDDTAMAMALATSLYETGGLHEADLMQRFVNWWRNGDYSCTGTCFDIGGTTRSALGRFQRSGNPMAGSTHPHEAGNGSLMRLSPVAVRYWRDRKTLNDVAARQSQTTHAATACVDACVVWANMIADAIEGVHAEAILNAAPGPYTEVISKIVEGSWRGLHRSAVQSSGYVAHSLEASLWCIARTHDFKSAVLMAANLGEDADTTAAITGQLAGAIYGAKGIPAHWRERVAWSDKISSLAGDLADCAEVEWEKRTLPRTTVSLPG
jgi:ADP-ribosyl-[dinitrogen reductase] hydrolase